jgi:hypothetical protein
MLIASTGRKRIRFRDKVEKPIKPVSPLEDITVEIGRY